MLEMIRRIFALAGERRKALIMAVTLNILQNCCTGGMYLLVMLAIISLVDGTFGLSLLLQCSLGMLALLALRYLLEYRVTTLQGSLGFEIMHDVRSRESGRLARLPLGTFQAEDLGSLTSVFTNDMSFVEMRCIATAANFIAGMTSVVCISLIMLFMDVRLALIAMAGFLPAAYVYALTKKIFRTAGVQRQTMEQGFIGAILEYVSGMETIRSYRLSGHIFKKITAHLEHYRDASAAYELKAVAPMMLYQLFVRLGMGLIFLCGLAFYLNDMISLPVFLFFAIISGTYYQPVEALLGEFGILNIIALSLKHMDALHELTPMPDEGREKPDRKEPALTEARFAYKPDQPAAVDGLSATFRPGTLTAVVGHSGSGKTTLLMLLARFWDVQEGTVSLGGSDVRHIPQRDLLAAFSIVFQDVYLFMGSIADNIRLGRAGATQDEVMAAAKAAGCHDFIMALPQGYDTQVGEGGCTLSGGEKQRLSIARAILKDAPVVLLDEAFSSVDPENAWAIQQGLSALTRQKTVIMVAHTLNHIRHADQILVMDAGKLAEAGSHEDLLRRDGIYRQLWERERTVKAWKLTA